MGVTMVGIHERSAREKIFSNQVYMLLAPRWRGTLPGMCLVMVGDIGGPHSER